MNFRPVLLGTIVCLSAWFSSSAQAFYQWQQDDFQGEIRGFVRAVGLAANNPNDVVLYQDDEIYGAGVFGRLLFDMQYQAWSAELHVVQSYLGDDLRTGGSRFAALLDVDRSDSLHWRYGNDKAEFVIDRLNVQYDTENLRLKLGRQPVNLATTFYFTPNDFFAPFAAQAFFRTYKPGVDAARLDWQWQNNTQLSLISVLDYEVDLSQATGRKTSPDWSDTAYLARLSTLTDHFEFGLILANVQGDDVIGADFQGEIGDWFGLRGEGHIRFPDEMNQGRDATFSIAIDKRFASTLTLRLEHFYQHSGASDRDDYQLVALPESQQFYLAKRYTAVGANYEFTPLLFGDAVVLFNHQDASKLIALYSTYSLSDESELSFGVNIPVGKQPEVGTLKTEFGALPHSINMEYRVYF